MTIAEKITQAKNDYDEVYEAGIISGQLSVMESSEAFKGNVSGNPITIKDISPIEHNVGVELSSDTLTDFSGVKVSVGGVNLFDKVAWIDYCNTYSPQRATLNDNYLGEECFSFTHNWKSTGIPIFMEGAFEPNTQYTISTEYTYAYDGKDNIKATLCTITYDDGEKEYVETTASNSRYNKFSFTSQAGKTIRGIQFSWVSSAYRVYCKYIQIEKGTTATEYEPYTIYGEYTANADGTVEGVKSRYPAMSFSTDAEGVIISVNYYRDIDKVLDNLAMNKALSVGEQDV